MKLPTWLRKLKVTRVALVDKPANPGAEVVIFKAQTPPTAPPKGPSDGTCPQCGAVLKDGTCPSCGYTAKDNPGLSDVSVPGPMGQGKPKKLPKRPPGSQEDDAYKAKGAGTMPEDEKPKNDAVADLVAKAEITEVRKELEKERAEKRLLVERVEKIELARRNEVYIAKAAEFDYLPGAKPDDLGPLLSKIDAALTDAGERERFWETLRGANAAIKHSQLFGERGVEGVGPTSDAEAALNKIAKSKQEADPKLDWGAAYAKAMTENPKLYEKYEADRRSANRR